jgi:hypothetical protein
MHNALRWLLAQSRVEDLRRQSADSALARRPRLRSRPVQTSPVTLRFGFPDDAVALGRLAALDSALPLAGPVLLAEVGGDLRAALSLSDRSVISDPFYPSAAVVELLRARADQLTQVGRRAQRGRERSRTRLRLVVWR